MVIDLGKPKVLKGLLAQRRHDARLDGIHGRPSLAKILQKRQQVHLVGEQHTVL
jgi:hypothetical protein